MRWLGRGARYERVRTNVALGQKRKAKAEFEKVIARTGHLDVQAQLAELA